MTTSTFVQSTLTGLVTIEDPTPVAPRPYDAATDARKFTFEEAIEAAEKRSAESGGIRQRVFTTDVAAADAHIIPRYLIQAI